MRNYLKNLAIHSKGNYDRMTGLLSQKVKVPEYLCNEKYVCIGEKDYPNALYQLTKPPLVLFYRGDISLLNRNTCFGVIGSRLPNDYGIEQTIKLVTAIKAKGLIVSGGARGIDTVAHRASLDARTVAILGSGLNVVYPPENKELFQIISENHLLISEYPNGTLPKKYNFPFRNRIIAALSDTVFVMSATMRSGTMTTVNESLELNKRIICLPYKIDDPCGIGCNRLIEEGAEILTLPYNL